ncbi:Dere\GG12083-PA-like protein [Anopheles sinensis]|uniref:Dere\GG12083-PA-like protein n=1 Tax=Anopheles sinensis TaxID=74873 RepID=A0A084W4F6_ANOSI|nr:Dere\GG12083-PA-like protein [Anopheles sinensis]
MLVFCELCYEQRTSGDTAAAAFHITSCCHIFCETCTKPSGQCPVCRKQCRTTPVNRDLAPTIKEYLVNQTDQMTKAEKIYQFQSSKMDKFIEANQGIFQEYDTLKSKIGKMKQMYEAYKKGIKEEQELINQLEQKRAAVAAGCSEPKQSDNSATESDQLMREDFFSTGIEAQPKARKGDTRQPRKGL